MAATIKDVARKAKVSTATVSLVIHNNDRISSETKTRVKRAIQELNYHPFRSARGLASQKSGNLGFIVTDDHFSRSEPFYTQIFLGTEFQARESEYYVLLTTIPSDFNERENTPRFVLEKNVEGIILAGKIPHKLIQKLDNYTIPLVFIDYYFSPSQHPVVMIDNISGGLKATQHLIDCGHKDIAFIAGDLQHPSISERFQGYKMALQSAGIPFREELTQYDEPYPAREQGYLAIKKLLNRKVQFTAIFACNDAMAIGIVQYLKEKNIPVPSAISVIGFDDVEANLSLDPPLTSIRVPKVEMGIQAVKIMTEILTRKHTGPRKLLMPVELVIRGSTCKRQGEVSLYK
ncbi:MAG: LacI family DNA-binding transcriptional regulator [Calditrichaeota bacterium]|nr:LacI family DNA-binding transcriptional regulator [Calditrichota bacterium]